MKILLFGENGQVGWELQRSLAALGELTSLDVEDKIGLWGDFSEPERLTETVRAVAPDVIVNAAAHTAVDKAESEPKFAGTINAVAPSVLARSARDCGAWLVHYSKKLLQQGVRDMVRISDARMSGTHYGSCVVHVSPEAAVGGPLALLKTGDVIALDIDARSLNVEVSDAELAARRAAWKAPARVYERGFARLYVDHATQAHQGCDFDFLMGNAPTPEPPIY